MSRSRITGPHVRRIRLILAGHIIWMSTVFFLGFWWSRFALRQSDQIAELQVRLGAPAEQIAAQLARTERMLFWESGAFYVLFAASTLLLLWLYWRDYIRSRSLHAFFASVTHELRTPLTSIRLQAESIADSAGPESGQKVLVERLIEDTMRLESQVESTLELARIEGGGPLFVQSLQLRPWLEQSLRYWREAYRDRISFDLQLEDLFVDVDPSAIQVILKNILENSMKHSHNEQVRVRIAAKSDKSGVLVSFHDNGKGFSGDANQLGKLFERGKSSQGTGVGLYLIRALMNRMGGAACFGTDPADGGFTVYLRFREGSTHD